MGRLDGKVAIVTGGAGGIGSSAAHIFAREGAKVVVADLDEQGAISTAENIKAAGGNAIGVGFNQGEETSIKRLIEATIQAYGALHVLLNNAAMLKWAAGGQDGQITELETDIWRGSYKINVEGVFLVTKHALPHLLKTGNASVINVASMNGHLGDISLTAYGTTKSSILGFSRYVAVQYGKKGVRCNSISPGVILTAPSKKNYHGFLAEITTKASCLNRLGEPEDIGNLALFLASDESSFVTGQDWKCDGGIAGISPPQTAALREYLEKKQKL